MCSGGVRTHKCYGWEGWWRGDVGAQVRCREQRPERTGGGHSTKLRSGDPVLAPRPQADPGLWADRAQTRWRCRWARTGTEPTHVPIFHVASGGKKAALQVNPENWLALFKDAR